MPLDAKFKPSSADILQWSGISPVPDVVLHQHKQAEIDKHPASWGFKHVVTMRWLTGIVLCVIPFCFLMPSYFIFAPVVMGVSGILVLAFADHIQFKGPAKWIEFYRHDGTVLKDASIPLPIRAIAAEMMSLLPESSWFLVGELVQEEVTLDPYLLIETDSGNVCVGVWDGDTIIYIAQKA